MVRRFIVLTALIGMTQLPSLTMADSSYMCTGVDMCKLTRESLEQQNANRQNANLQEVLDFMAEKDVKYLKIRVRDNGLLDGSVQAEDGAHLTYSDVSKTVIKRISAQDYGSTKKQFGAEQPKQTAPAKVVSPAPTYTGGSIQ